MIAEVLNAMSRQEKQAARQAESKQRFVFGNVELDTIARIVTVAGTVVGLTPREYDLLVALAAGAGNLVTNEELRHIVWHGSIEPGSRAISQCVSELRRKVEPDPLHPQHIQLVRKFGYRLAGSWI
jgi:DNA-binding response OmpR family regulator